MTNVDRVTEVPNRAARGELREPADLVVPEGGAEGEIVAACDHLGGSPLFRTGREAEAHILDDGDAGVHAGGRGAARRRRQGPLA